MFPGTPVPGSGFFRPFRDWFAGYRNIGHDPIHVVLQKKIDETVLPCGIQGLLLLGIAVALLGILTPHSANVSFGRRVHEVARKYPRSWSSLHHAFCSD